MTPSLQFQGGGKYGIPITEAGIDPASGCGKPLFGDRYNASTCPGVVDIPNPFTGVFDPIGAFTEPNELIANLQLSYDVSPRIQLVGQLTNIVNYCWGGTQDSRGPSTTATSARTATLQRNGLPGRAVRHAGRDRQPARLSRARKSSRSGNSRTSRSLGPAIISALNGSYKTPIQFYFTANIKI